MFVHRVAMLHGFVLTSQEAFNSVFQSHRSPISGPFVCSRSALALSCPYQGKEMEVVAVDSKKFYLLGKFFIQSLYHQVVYAQPGGESFLSVVL